MNREDLIRMAREAGIIQVVSCDLSLGSFALLERFAALVAAAEREACAELVQANANACDPGSVIQVYLASNAAAIRAKQSL
jgi:hypothetical protein